MTHKRKNVQDIGIARPAMGLVVGGTILSVGGSVIAGVGGSTAASAGAGVTAVASFLPVAGTVIGGGIVVGQLRNLQMQIEPKRRKRR